MGPVDTAPEWKVFCKFHDCEYSSLPVCAGAKRRFCHASPGEVVPLGVSFYVKTISNLLVSCPGRQGLRVLLRHKNLKRSVHDWALVYEWKGSNPDLKPVFLTSHQGTSLFNASFAYRTSNNAD